MRARRSRRNVRWGSRSHPRRRRVVSGRMEASVLLCSVRSVRSGTGRRVSFDKEQRDKRKLVGLSHPLPLVPPILSRTFPHLADTPTRRTPYRAKFNPRQMSSQPFFKSFSVNLFFTRSLLDWVAHVLYVRSALRVCHAQSKVERIVAQVDETFSLTLPSASPSSLSTRP